MKIKKDKIEMICCRGGSIKYDYNPYKGEFRLLAPLRIFPCKSFFNVKEMEELSNLINTDDFKITIEKNNKESKNEDSVYAMKYASQQMLIDKLEQQVKKQKEVIDRLIELNQIINNSDYVYSQDEITTKNLNILKEVSKQ